MHGDLGSGKTTFTQGLLKALGAEGPYISPTFLIMKEYPIRDKMTLYHIDAYRITSDDMKLLGWEELIQNKKTILVVEWPERIADILPQKSSKKRTIHINFWWKSEQERQISFTLPHPTDR